MTEEQKEPEAKPVRKQLTEEEIKAKVEAYNKRAKEHMVKVIKNFIPGISMDGLDVDKFRKVTEKSGDIIKRMLVDCVNKAQIDIVKETTEYGTVAKTFTVNVHKPRATFESEDSFTTNTDCSSTDVHAQISIALDFEPPIIEEDKNEDET